MLYELTTIYETKEQEEMRDDQKCKVRYLIQKRKYPVRKEAADLLNKLKNNMLKIESVRSANANNQNISRTTIGMTFNEGSREDNVSKNLVKDRDKVMLSKLEKEKNKTTEDKPVEKKNDLQLAQYAGTDDVPPFRILDLNLPGDMRNPDDFLDGKAEFEEFIEDIKKEIFEECKRRIRVNLNFRKQMSTDRFNGVCIHYNIRLLTSIVKKRVKLYY